MNNLLDFPSISYNGRETPLTLRSLLYKNGPSCRVSSFDAELVNGQFGSVIQERLPLVVAIHQVLNSYVSSGGSKSTLKNRVLHVREFYTYCEQLGRNATHATACELYCSWVDEIYDQLRRKGGNETAVYGKATSLASLLGEATDLGRALFVCKSGLTSPRKSRGGMLQIDKQDLQATKKFVQDLLDIRSALGASAFQQKLPVSIKFQDGAAHDLYGGLSQFEKEIDSKLLDSSMSVRYPLYNLRSDAEKLLFISQTSMCLSDADKLKAGDYRFETKGGICEVREYKGRKGGEVVFRVYSEYKPMLVEFIRFRKSMGIDSYTDKLFGKVPQPGTKVSDIPHPRSLTNFMSRAGRKVISARVLRKTRQNWLARKGGDLRAAAELGQHEVKTFVRDYFRPHHQTAATEWTGFFKRTLYSENAVLVGECNGKPEPIEEKPEFIDSPDCKNEALCLFCINYKGIASYSYVWSLLSYRCLRDREKLMIKLSLGDVSGVEAVISRIDDIVEAFRCVGQKYSSWASKAMNSVSSGNYHPRWSGYIQLVEVMGL